LHEPLDPPDAPQANCCTDRAAGLAGIVLGEPTPPPLVPEISPPVNFPWRRCGAST